MRPCGSACMHGQHHSTLHHMHGMIVSIFKRPGWYCVGCEAYKDDSEMEGDHACPLHKTRCVEREEENYFFALSKYQQQIQVCNLTLSR